MARRPRRDVPRTPAEWFATVSKGAILGVLDGTAGRTAFRLYEDRRVLEITWNGSGIEASLNQPPGRVQVDASDPEKPSTGCSICDKRDVLCPHVAAAVFRWIDVRPTMLRKGPGTVWRSHSRQPFLTLAPDDRQELDLSHLDGSELFTALRFQLSLHAGRTARARLVEGKVELRTVLPSGSERVVRFTTALLPFVLPGLRTLPGLVLEGELADVELSETRLRPVLEAAWIDGGIRLCPGYRLPDGEILPLADVHRSSAGRWARIGTRLCRLLDPETPLVPFFRRGETTLPPDEALRFLTLDHPQLQQAPWYLPRGPLADFDRPLLPSLRRLEVVVDGRGRYRLLPTFAAGGRELSWAEAVDLLGEDLVSLGDTIVRPPELAPLERAGFALPSRGRSSGLVGDRLAVMRLIAESDLPVATDDPGLGRLVQVLSEEPTGEPEVPDTLLSDLRAYQRRGYGWLWQLRTAGVGALLADDMGLGKSHQVMALLCRVRRDEPSSDLLVVCPRGVLEHWADLLERFAPSLGTVVFHGSQRELPRPGGATVLTTYDVVVRSLPELMERGWTVAVYDEAQRIKNPRTKSARAARRLPADHRVALTGTPIENHLVELWSVVDLLVPGYLGSERDFTSRYRHPGADDLLRLRQRVNAITLRRVKEQVLDDLPDKVEDIRTCRMTPGQEELYRRIERERVDALAASVLDAGQDIPYVHVFAALTRLKQVCDHPELVDPERAGDGSGKLEVVDELLEEALGSEQQVVVFSHYVKMIRLLERHLSEHGIRSLVLTGQTRDRGRVVGRFNSGQHERVLLASLLAGGEGIDLTGASVVIHLDRWWNPAREDQATDRVHRMGQKRFVQVFKLVTRDSVEERIDRIIRAKARLLEEVVPPTEDVVRSLGRGELAELLGVPTEQRSAI